MYTKCKQTKKLTCTYTHNIEAEFIVTTHSTATVESHKINTLKSFKQAVFYKQKKVLICRAFFCFKINYFLY